ncbi:MAG TPA: urate oxidase [Candidatus Limnocylindria bacterium]|jgi:urate oxidase|nr:urate oxidase [Candidatus Limnocylindria bacterium]
MTTEISYGKARVVFYRLGGRDIAPLAASVDIDVFGERFMHAYTHGDNRDVVATDTMKNFVYAMAAEYTGRTLLGLCAFLGRRFLETYPVMESLRVTAREVPLDATAGERGPSDVLFRSTRGDVAVGEVSLKGGSAEPQVTSARSGWEGMVLVKTTGSSFASFARDDYTTLPELVDRPLTIHINVYWRYADLRDGVAEGLGLLGPRAVRDEIERIFHEFNSHSIQHLVHEIGTRLLAAHPQLAEIEFVAENHTPDHVRDGASGVKIFAEPRATFGKIGLVLRR